MEKKTPGRKPQVEKERHEFKRLLMENPNYFGNITEGPLAKTFESVTAASGNTDYEELRCVGLYPEQNMLEAVFEIKRSSGYSGDLCDGGSIEYVAFYIDWDDGAGFVSVGAPATTNVHDLDAANDTSIWYAAKKGFIPTQLLGCKEPQIVRVRAILSWEDQPTGPGYTPVWGNVIDEWVQIEPKKTKFAVVPGFEMATLDPEDLTLAESLLPMEDPIALVGDKAQIKAMLDHSLEVEMIQPKDVEDQRHNFKSLVSKNPNHFGAISASKDEGEILEAVLKLEPKYSEYLQAQLAFDPSLLIPVEIYNPKTSYEQLLCVGLYPEQDLLEAVIEVKKPAGYKGDLCSLGSLEYVAFYIDWGDGGGYQWEGTSTVRVHDIPEVDGKHLNYSVYKRIANPKFKSCKIENIVRVKAILSWNTPPTGPFYNPTWGNALQREIQIRPNTGQSARCSIDVVNEVHADDIQQAGASKGYGIQILGGASVPGVWDRPFGGVVAVWGKVDIPGAVYYRFRYTTDDPSDPLATWENITDTRRYRKIFPFGGSGNRTPDPDGWFRIDQYNTDDSNYPLQALVHWRTGTRAGQHHMRLEMADVLKTAMANPCDVSILLDNKAPELLEFGGINPPPIPTIGVAVKDSVGAWKRCEEFEGRETIHVWGNFRDEHFRGYRLTVFGGNIHPSGHHFNSGSYSPGTPGILGSTGIIGASPGGPGKEITTLDLCTVPLLPNQKPIRCAYGIRLHITDRAVVGYLRGYEYDTTAHGRNAYVTFDWDPNKGTVC